MRFSVVVPTYNRVSTLRQCLTGLLAQDSLNYEIIVVDDGSTDGTAEVLTQEFPRTRIRYFQQKNAGPAAARNRGIQEAGGEIIAFTDDDCLAPLDWLSRLDEGFRRHPEVVGVGGPLLAPPEIRRTNLLARYEQYVVQVQYGARDQEVLAGFNCPAGGTNNMAYRRAALQAIGGFDASFPYPAAEDADLKWRLAQTEAQFLYIPVTLTHLQTYAWPAFRRQQFVRGKGRVYFDRKWSRRPTTVGVLLRFGRGLARLLFQLNALPEPALLRPAFEELWFNTLGQWAAIREFRP
jgi:glycosyltransferase involved in cell wall biosynthesis